jgi:hypothetical protein
LKIRGILRTRIKPMKWTGSELRRTYSAEHAVALFHSNLSSRSTSRSRHRSIRESESERERAVRGMMESERERAVGGIMQRYPTNIRRLASRRPTVSVKSEMLSGPELLRQNEYEQYRTYYYEASTKYHFEVE